MALLPSSECIASDCGCLEGKRRKEIGEREGGREGEERKRTRRKKTDFPGSIVIKNLSANAGT